MKTAFLAIALIAATAPSRAQTGQDLLKLCESKNAVENISCELYISGFVHGMQLAQELHGTICLPPNLTGAEATEIYIRTLHDVGKGVPPAHNPFFKESQNAAVAASLGMAFKCPEKTGDVGSEGK
jgi:hypothetical protein